MRTLRCYALATLATVICNSASLGLMNRLSNGVEVPLVGFGTAGGVNGDHVRWAVELGVNLFDTAQATEWYSEQEVYRGLQGWPRQRLFLQSKLHPKNHGFDRTLATFPDSLAALQTDYLDGFLLHYPHCFSAICQEEPEGTWKDSWRALEQLYGEGKIRGIGVSNFNPRLLRELIEHARVGPHIVQNHFDPFNQDKEVRNFCEEHGIFYQAYSALGTQWMMRNNGVNPVLTHPIITSIASKHGKSPAQVVLRWALGHNIGIIPRSKSQDRIKENTQLDFELETDDILLIDDLDGFQPSDNTVDDESFAALFLNQCEEELSIFWESPAGEMHPLTTMPAHTTFEPRTYPGHRFRVLPASGAAFTFPVSPSQLRYELRVVEGVCAGPPSRASTAHLDL